MGMTLLCGRLQSRLQSNAMDAPNAIVQGRRERCEPEVDTMRAMCGVANPMKLMGPQKAVVTAESKPVASKSMWRVRVVFTPRFCA